METARPPKKRRLWRLAAGALALGLVAVAALWLARPAIEEEEIPPAAPAPAGFLDGGAGFALQVGEVVTPYATFSTYALPGDTVRVEALFVGGEAEAQADGGDLTRVGPRRWRWAAPEAPGLSQIEVTSGEGETITLNAFTLVPFDHQSEAIGDYPLGDYEDEPMGGDSAYVEPPGFVRVTPGLADARVSPHFTLGQFLAKQESGWPKYLVLDPDLLLKLERVLYAVRRAGVDVQTLSVLSGFRTPAYNAAIGNETSYSRHLYGDAADVFVDADGDGQDGRRDRRRRGDARRRGMDGGARGRPLGLRVVPAARGRPRHLQPGAASRAVRPRGHARGAGAVVAPLAPDRLRGPRERKATSL